MRPKALLTARLLAVGLVAIASLALALPTESTTPNGASLSPLTRATALECVYNGCVCNTRSRRHSQGQFCGSCRWEDTGDYVITDKRNSSHVYECAPDGKCCDYGYLRGCDRDQNGFSGPCNPFFRR